MLMLDFFKFAECWAHEESKGWRPVTVGSEGPEVVDPKECLIDLVEVGDDESEENSTSSDKNEEQGSEEQSTNQENDSTQKLQVSRGIHLLLSLNQP